MRLYSFTNMYISPLQCGLQTAHVVSRLYRKYRRAENCAVEVMNLELWDEEFETIYILNGGYQSNLELLHAELEKHATVWGLPFTLFHEEHAALNGALTCVGVVIPEFIYELNIEQTIEDLNTSSYDEDGYQLIDGEPICVTRKHLEASIALAQICKSYRFAG